VVVPELALVAVTVLQVLQSTILGFAFICASMSSLIYDHHRCGHLGKLKVP